MSGRDLVAGLLGTIAVSLAMHTALPPPFHAASVAAEARDVEVNAALIREIQFMLSRLGIDPGPIDGIAGPQTLRAVGKFEAQSGLPAADLVSGGKISAVFVERLRSEAARTILGGEKKGLDVPEPQAAPPSPVAVAPPQPTAPAPDPFAACTFNPGDFQLASSEYTPDKFLQVRVEGSTARAVTSLTTRLDEARQIAG